MSTTPTVVVLSPSLGGDFFGDVLTGLAREVVASDGRIVVIETLQEHAPRDEAGTPGDFSMPVGWTHANGVVSITTAVGQAYLERLRAAGIPAVTLSGTEIGTFEAPSARPDNRQGTAAAVAHFADHGHTRIGFLGNTHQYDIRERFEAYREVLTERGLDCGDDLTFEAADNSEEGGAAAVAALLDLADRPTALMAATDRNALGAIAVLTEAGIKVPQDISVAAFDNTAQGWFAQPSLSSVEPWFDEVGALAGRLVLAAINGENPPAITHVPETATFLVRESCGCATDTMSVGNSTARPRATTEMRERLREALLRDLQTDAESIDPELLATVTATTGEAVRLLALGDDASGPQIDAFADSLVLLGSQPRTLRRLADTLTQFAQSPVGGEGAGGVAGNLAPRLSAALWRAQADAYLRDVVGTEAAISEQYAVDAGLLSTSGADARQLKWLGGTHVKAAALGLWEGDVTGEAVRIAGAFDIDESRAVALDQVMTTEEFPPRALIDRASTREREVCVVVPVSTASHDWGLLAIVAAIEPTTTRETYQHWAALLSAAMESERRQEAVRRAAFYDALTGLPNRKLLVRELKKAIALYQRARTPYAVLFLDLDGFKLINDSLGHQIGDQVLQAVATAIRGELRAVDTAARFGGDEFLVLLADSDAESALAAATRLQSAIAAIKEFEGHEIVTRASIGIATASGGYTSADDALRDADSAMYRAKAAEPGSVAFFDDTMHESAASRSALAREVLLGLQERQFEVQYQPIVNLVSGQTDRFEALLRWHHPERGTLSSDDFLPAIADTAFIVQVGHWVLDEVCRALVSWKADDVSVSINISDKEFWTQDLLTEVLSTLERYSLPPERLTLEITEAVLMRRPEMALRMMGKLHDAGLRLHIDDFGTGFSSLETLHRFPVDAFKIDRTFIQTLTSGEDSAELITSLVKLGKALGISVVAEGVETDEQLEFLRELGCATGQGFLFMPAVTGDRVAGLVGKPLGSHDAGRVAAGDSDATPPQ